MSSDTAATASGRTPVPSVTVGTSRARIAIVAVALAGGALAAAAALLWHPWPERNDLSYASFAGVRDAAWAGLVLDGIGTAAAGVALGLAVCLLAPTRGAAWANVGAVLVAIGGMLFATAIVGYATFGWYATATDAIPAEAGASLMSYAEENFDRVGALQVPGFLLLTIGTLVLMVALWRCRAVPRWLPVTIAVLTVVAFVGLGGRVLDVLQAAQLASFALVAWHLWRASSRQVAVA